MIELKKELDRRKGHRFGLFVCPLCSRLFENRIEHIKNGRVKSCGCGKVKHGHTSNDGYRSLTYKTWSTMIKRCRTKKEYANISVCERWKDFNNFLTDMGERPSELYTIDRFPNKKGNYEPNNCRWATHKQQSRNLTNNLIVMYEGEKKTLIEWCEVLGLDYFRMRERIFRNDIPVEMAFAEPKRSSAILNYLKNKRA